MTHGEPSTWSGAMFGDPLYRINPRPLTVELPWAMTLLHQSVMYWINQQLILCAMGNSSQHTQLTPHLDLEGQDHGPWKTIHLDNHHHHIIESQEAPWKNIHLRPQDIRIL